MCITAPCLSYDERLPATPHRAAISGVDLARAGASDALLERGVELVADQFYPRVRPRGAVEPRID